MSYQTSNLPATLSVGIVHLGLGAFHRAHQAVYTEDAIEQAGGDWGICAVAMRSRELADVLRAQDGRYSLIEQQATGPTLRQLSVIRDVLCLPDSPEAVAAQIADENVHVVTVTVTEKGYCFQGPNRQLNLEDPQVAHDLLHPWQARTMPGILVYGLQRRMQAGGSGLSILSCDNLPHNGQCLQNIVVSFAAQLDENLADWIKQTCRFPSTMVDRITPASKPETLQLAESLLGKADVAAIETEPFLQWVIEDNFAGPRPAWEVAGAQFVSDVAPYEDMKLRMLNGAHSLIAYLGALTGVSAVRDVMAIREFRAVVDRHMTLASKTLKKMPAEFLTNYKEQLLTRFENPAIDHRCLQIAMDGSQKLPQRIFTPASHSVKQGHSADTYALTAALWFCYVSGVNEQGDAIICSDPMAEQLQHIVHSEGELTQRIVALGHLLGDFDGLFDNAAWVEKIAEFVEEITAKGAMAGVSELLKSNSP